VVSQQNRVIVTRLRFRPSSRGRDLDRGQALHDQQRRGHPRDRTGVCAGHRHKGSVQAPPRSSSSSSRTRCRHSLTGRSSRSSGRRRSPISSRTSGRRKRSSPPTSTRSTSATAAYGIESAAQTYFGSEVNHTGCGTPSHQLCVQQLKPWEAALLAGIIQSPTAYDPANHPVRRWNAGMWCCARCSNRAT